MSLAIGIAMLLLRSSDQYVELPVNFDAIFSSKSGLMLLHKVTSDQRNIFNYEVYDYSPKGSPVKREKPLYAELLGRTPRGEPLIFRSFMDYDRDGKREWLGDIGSLSYKDISIAGSTCALSDGRNLLLFASNGISALVKSVGWMEPWQLAPDGTSVIHLKNTGNRISLTAYNLSGKVTSRKIVNIQGISDLRLVDSLCDLIWLSKDRLIFLVRSKKDSTLAVVAISSSTGRGKKIGDISIKNSTSRYYLSSDYPTKNLLTYRDGYVYFLSGKSLWSFALNP